MANVLKKISIIVPVYNAERYLRRCIESLLNQLYKNIEIIVIDDGSTDNSSKIIEEYERIDNRIKLIQVENSGVSNARNVGIKNATGEYIAFVDSDDYVNKDIYLKIIDIMESNNCDIGICSFSFVYDNNTNREMKLPWETGKVFNKKEIQEIIIPAMLNSRICRESNIEFESVVWRFVVKKSILLDNQVYFDTKLDFGEDQIFCTKLYSICNSLAVVNEPYYYYYKNLSSATNVYDANRLEKETLTQDILAHTLIELNLMKKNESNYAQHRFFVYKAAIDNCFHTNSPSLYGKMDKIRSIIYQFNSDIYIKKIKSINLSKVNRFILICLRYKLRMPILILYYIKNI